MASHFIVRNQAKADELTELLSKRFFLNDPIQFVNLYNSGVIMKRQDDVVEIVSIMEEAYKDVVAPRRSGSPIVVLDGDEVVLDELLSNLDKWRMAGKLNRMVSRAISDGFMNAEQVIALEKMGGPAGYALSAVEEVFDEEAQARAFALSPLPRIEELNREEAEFAQEFFTLDNPPESLAGAINSDEVILLDTSKIMSVDTGFVSNLSVPDFN